jgi:hypothetical protein
VFESENKRKEVPDQTREKKVCESPSQWEKAGCRGGACYPRDCRKHKIRGLGRLVWTKRLYLPSNQNKKNWRHGSNSKAPA